MQPLTLSLIFITYFAVILGISKWIGKKGSITTFYNGDRKSPWFVVAFGMVGATLSGVTFISVPGEVGNSSWQYLQFVLGNFVGYIIIASLLLPYYYRKNIISIYSVLNEKMGKEGYLTTSGFFILSKVIGAAFRLYLASIVIHLAITAPLGISFPTTVFICLLLIWLYTIQSGIKAVVWSDMLQTAVLLGAVFVTIFAITKELSSIPTFTSNTFLETSNIKVFNFAWNESNNFFKQFTAGIFMTIALNGFDQDIIQKNLTCKTSNKARKNMLVFSVLFIFTVILFLFLGSLLHYYSEVKEILIPEKTDQLYPLLALNHLSKSVTILFILGISAAAFSSADSATTALTTAFSIDFLKIEKFNSKQQMKYRQMVHIGVSVVLFLVIIAFYYLNNDSVVVAIFKAAGYTYGPILGVFIFAFFIPRKPTHKAIMPICIASPILTFAFTQIIQQLNTSYKFGFELIIINFCFTTILLTFFSNRCKSC